MMTDASSATRIKATRVRQTECIIKGLAKSGTTKPSSSSGSGQHKRVRFQSRLGFETRQKMQTGGQEARTRKRPAEPDAERLEEGRTVASGR